MSLIAWFGGKSSKKFQDFINVRIPKDGIKTYIEPFSGAMGTYMDGKDMNFEQVIFNDFNKHQVNLFMSARDPEKLLKSIDKMYSTILKTDETDVDKKREFYKSVYRKFVDNDFLDNMNFNLPDYSRAALWAFLITSSFSAVNPRGGGFSGYQKDKDRLKLEVLIKKLKTNKYTKKLQTITNFHNEDFEDVIKRYDAEDTYMYLDPPYATYDPEKDDDTNKRLFWYGSKEDGVFGAGSHGRLLKLLRECKSRWSLSYYYFPLLEELLPKDKYIWLEKEVFRSSAQGGNNHESKGESSKKKGKELLILNYDPETGKKLF